MTPSVDELKVTILVLKSDWLVIFTITTKGKALKQIIHQNVVLLIDIITIMVNVLKT